MIREKSFFKTGFNVLGLILNPYVWEAPWFSSECRGLTIKALDLKKCGYKSRLPHSLLFKVVLDVTFRGTKLFFKDIFF